MKKQTIALCMIIKGIGEELKLLKRCLKSIAPFMDGVFITFTFPDKKKIKKTWQWCEKQGFNLSYFRWIKDFAAARNFNLKQVPQDQYKWIFWCDVDDVVRGAENLHLVANKADEKNVDAVFMDYLYQVLLDEKGNINLVLIKHLRERLIRNNNAYKWVSPIHETLIEQRPTIKMDIGDLMGEGFWCDIVHLSNDERRIEAIERNVEILEQHIKDTQGKDPRPIYYLAKAYFDLRSKDPKRLEKAEPLLLAYLQMSGWAEERSQAWEYLAEIYRIWGKHNMAIKCCLNAIQEAPQFPSVYLNLALCYVFLKDWDKALHWVRIAKTLSLPKTTLVVNPYELEARALEILWHITLNKNMIDEMWAVAQKMEQFMPDNQSVQERVAFALAMKEQKEITKLIVNLGRYLKAIGEEHKMSILVKAIPTSIENNPIVTKIIQQYAPPKTWGENEVAIFCGPGFTNWSPARITDPKESFLGGSEEAVVYLSKELAKLGWKVTVFADPGDEEGDYDGVTWLPYYKFNHKDTFNILVGWRNIGFFDGNFKSKKNYLWCHDVLNPLEFTPERLSRLDKVIVLSKAHYQTAPNIPENKVLFSTNGYFEHYPEIKPQNNPKWCIWTSSYDRGLEHLLEIWPEIIKAVPDAQLHIFYGWQLFEKFYHDNPERMAWKEKMEKAMNYKGIVHHGRVPQPEVEKWYKKCGIFSYPSHFFEINCISAFKSELWGAVPVTTNYAALDETVQYGIKVKGDIYDPKVKEEYKKKLIWALQHPEWQEEQRKKMMPWAREKYSWTNVAKQWTSEFKGIEIDEAIDTIIKEKPVLGRYMPLKHQKKHGLSETS